MHPFHSSRRLKAFTRTFRQFFVSLCRRMDNTGPKPDSANPGAPVFSPNPEKEPV